MFFLGHSVHYFKSTVSGFLANSFNGLFLRGCRLSSVRTTFTLGLCLFLGCIDVTRCGLLLQIE